MGDCSDSLNHETRDNQRAVERADQSGQPKTVRFNDLAACRDEIWIELDGKTYRLRRTRNDRLILTK